MLKELITALNRNVAQGGAPLAPSGGLSPQQLQPDYQVDTLGDYPPGIDLPAAEHLRAPGVNTVLRRSPQRYGLFI